MKGALVRVGIDSSCGHYHGLVDSVDNDYLYIPIPQSKPEQREGMETPYQQVFPALSRWESRFNTVPEFPIALRTMNMHLDPDFERLTYGDQGVGRGVRLSTIQPGDFLAFFGAFRDVRQNRLVYGLFGIFHIVRKITVEDVLRQDSTELLRENAHLRIVTPKPTDLVFWADPARSGRLSRLIPMAEYRASAWRVTPEMLAAWDGLGVNDGYIQRSVNPPIFLNPERFIEWLDKEMKSRDIHLLHDNWPAR